MKHITRFISLIIILGTIAAATTPADAGAYLYAGKRKRINCGIVGVGTRDITSGYRYANQDAIDKIAPNGYAPPSLFLKLDSLTSMKPAGWSIENPMSNGNDKSSQVYWIVPLSSVRDLSQMNILYLPGQGSLTLSEEEREKLRTFVDGGGVLWVDNVNSTSVFNFSSAGPFFIQQLKFSAGGSSDPQIAVSRYHPLVSTPYWLTDPELQNLGVVTGGMSMCYCDVDMATGTVPSGFDILYAVVDGIDSGGNLDKKPTVVANAYGSGRVVATANGVGSGCLASEPYSLPNLKFAYNLMAYASTWTDMRKDPRHSGSSIDTVGGSKLLERWSMRSSSGRSSIENAPLIYKNTVFCTIGRTLYALEQNGDNHGGIYGPPGAHGEVVIWSWTPDDGAMLSAPTIATVQNPEKNSEECNPVEAILVESASGKVYVLRAFPLNPDTGLPWPTIAPMADFDVNSSSVGGGGNSGSFVPSPPIYVNGWIYALGTDGRLNAINPCLKKYVDGGGTISADVPDPLWKVPDAALGFNDVTPRCGPSFGYVRNDTSGAVVGMVYWYATPTDVQRTRGEINDRAYGVPVSVNNDRVRIETNDSSTNKTVVRASYPYAVMIPMDPSHPEKSIRIVLPDGTLMAATDAQFNRNISNPTAVVMGSIVITTAAAIPHDSRIYASYNLSYKAGAGSSYFSLQLEPTDNYQGGGPLPPREFAGTPAMGPNNMFFANSVPKGGVSPSGGCGGGSVLAYMNDGSNTTRTLKWHYYLHSGVSGVFGMDAIVPPVVSVKVKQPDNTYKLVAMKDPQPSSSPAVSNGKVFVAVSGTDSDTGKPMGALLCLKANPEFVVRITESAGFDSNGNPIKRPKSLINRTTGRPMNVKLWQPNLIIAPQPTLPLMTARVVPSDMIDYDRGTITFNDFANFKLMDNQMVMTNTFSPSLPVWVYLDNVEVPVDWSTWGPYVANNIDTLTGNVKQSRAATNDSVDLSGWNNLLWYYVVPDVNGLPCSGIHSSPVVIGNTVYFVTDDGVMVALDTETGESQGGPTAKEPVWMEEIGSGSPGGSATGFRASIAGSNGVLAAITPDGIHAFTNTTTLVADGNRVAEVDGAGELAWAVDSISWPATPPTSAQGGMPMKSGSINKPSRARYTSNGEVLLVNSGADQVCKMDRAGNIGVDGAGNGYVRWIYTKFADPKHLLRAGQPLKLESPTDAMMWQEVEPPAANGASVVHCIIADSGNSRVLDLVYRMKNNNFIRFDGSTIANNDPDYIDSESGFILPELNWVSRTDTLNERYTFDCVQLVTTVDNNKQCQDIWAACSNYTTGTDFYPSVMGAAGAGGAIIALRYRVRPEPSRSTAPGAWDYNDTSTSGDLVSGTIVARCDRISDGSGTIPLASPRFFQVIESPIGRSLLICDNNGVCLADIKGGSLVVQPGMTLNSAQYSSIMRSFDATPTSEPPAALHIPLMAMCAQKLSNGHWLICNGYSGAIADDLAVTFNGEVFEYDPNFDPAKPASAISWCSPKIEAPSSGEPWKQMMGNSYSLQQPKSAFRMF